MGKNAESQAAAERRAEITAETAYQGKFIRVRKDIILLDDHPPKIWDIIIPPGAVGIVPVTEDGKVVLVEQWRRAIGKITIEIPAGMLEQGEPALECAQRELQEETGLRAESLVPFGGCYVSPGISSEYIHLFLAKDLQPSPLRAEDTDGIDVRAVSLSEAFKMIEEGAICDAKTIIGILKYARTL